MLPTLRQGKNVLNAPTNETFTLLQGGCIAYAPCGLDFTLFFHYAATALSFPVGYDRRARADAS